MNINLVLRQSSQSWINYLSTLDLPRNFNNQLPFFSCDGDGLPGGKAGVLQPIACWVFAEEGFGGCCFVLMADSDIAHRVIVRKGMYKGN